LYLFLIVESLSVAKAVARPRRHVPGPVADLLLHLPHPDQRLDADRTVARDRNPLPLISYGGSATMMFFMAIG